MSAKSTITPEFVSLRDAAVYSGFGVDTLHAKVTSGELPAYKITDAPNAALRVRLRDVEALLKPVAPTAATSA